LEPAERGGGLNGAARRLIDRDCAGFDLTPDLVASLWAWRMLTASSQSSKVALGGGFGTCRQTARSSIGREADFCVRNRGVTGGS
jgi:hypothetical protein